MCRYLAADGDFWLVGVPFLLMEALDSIYFNKLRAPFLSIRLSFAQIVAKIVMLWAASPVVRLSSVSPKPAAEYLTFVSIYCGWDA